MLCFFSRLTIRVLVLATGWLDPFVNTVNVASAVVDVGLLVQFQDFFRVIAERKDFEELCTVSSVEADLVKISITISPNKKLQVDQLANCGTLAPLVVLRPVNEFPPNSVEAAHSIFS